MEFTIFDLKIRFPVKLPARGFLLRSQFGNLDAKIQTKIEITTSTAYAIVCKFPMDDNNLSNPDEPQQILGDAEMQVGNAKEQEPGSIRRSASRTNRPEIASVCVCVSL